MEFGIFAGVCLAFVIAFLVVRCKKGAGPLALILKSLASITFVLAAIYALRLNGTNVYNLLIVFGLVFALFGDIVLDLKVAYKEHEKFYLNSGMVSFSVSSLLYIVAVILIWHQMDSFLLTSLGSLGLALVFGAVVLLLAKPLKLDFTGHRVLTYIYSTVCFMAAIISLIICFFYPGFALFAVGVLLVLISDLVLSLMYFGGKADSKVLCCVNHILYYIGELLVVSYLFFQLG